ncbi:MAG: hypothetical protein NZ750_05510 [Anaerolineae bacterium]|nr:hypothetical protein [Anaerolineae bacterium]MDW8172906.1 hypothetical protein [Anaerolineae bacterium]
MLNIAFHPTDQALAEKLQADLSKTYIRLEKPMLIVLLSQAALADAEVSRSVQQAQAEGARIAVILPQALTSLPAPYAGLPVFSATDGRYEMKGLMAYLNRVDLGETRIARSRALLLLMLVSVAVMFVLALWGVGSGQVRFPSSEYATDDAIAFSQIQTLTFPTLDPLMPRSTEDALAFPATVQAAPTRNRPYLAGTATALPRNLAATQEAIATNALMTMQVQTQAAQVSSTPTR